jgi:hypothetical protein
LRNTQPHTIKFDALKITNYRKLLSAIIPRSMPSAPPIYLRSDFNKLYILQTGAAISRRALCILQRSDWVAAALQTPIGDDRSENTLTFCSNLKGFAQALECVTN